MSTLVEYGSSDDAEGESRSFGEGSGTAVTPPAPRLLSPMTTEDKNPQRTPELYKVHWWDLNLRQ
ncbi:MAG: hypothetical protein LQ346_001229 [Caloplaca aetnensis]|nr:MAG: hypothetical protein LQ346_001229 [Caloplaca aetnensis]